MDNIKRRTFIKKGGRMVLTGGLAVIGVYLGLRPESKRGFIDGCIRNNPCSGCSQFKGCPEPRALAFKANNGGNSSKDLKQEKPDE